MQSVTLGGDCRLLLGVKGASVGSDVFGGLDPVEGSEFEARLLDHVVQREAGSAYQGLSTLKHLLVFLHILLKV